ncbi:MAG: hypothetical protein ACI9YE_003653, partial [Psychroserpens sp.]
MSLEIEHRFTDKEFFNKMKNKHLTKAKYEIALVNELMDAYYGQDAAIEKEIQISTACYLVRRCNELEYVALGHLKESLNSILHAHMVSHQNDGSLLYKSD